MKSARRDPARSGRPPDVAPPHPFEVIGTATADAGLLTLDGEPVDTSGWDPYAGWDGVSG